MPKQQTKGGVLAGVRSESYGENVEKEVVHDMGGSVPPFEHGVAQLVEAKFGVYDNGDYKGKPFFYAAGVIIEPATTKDESGRDIPIAGMQTRIGPMPLCQTKTQDGKVKTFAENEFRIINEIKKLNGGSEGMPPTLAELEDFVGTLVEAAPYFRCRAWKGKASKQYPNPAVNHVWNGIIQDYDPEVGLAENAVEDNTEEAPPLPKSSAPASTKASTPKATKAAKEEPAKEEELSLAQYGEKADAGDKNAQRHLQALATEHGVDSDSAEDWTTVATQLAEVMDAGGDDTSGDEAQQEEASDEDQGDDQAQAEPEKGDSCFYKPPKARKEVECEVTAVFPGKRTCNLKSSDGTVYKGVSWDSCTF